MAWKPPYVETEAMRHYLKLTSDRDDTELANAIEAASRAVDRDTNRQFGLVTAEQRFYTAHYDRRRCRWVVEIDDVMSAVGFAAIIVDSDGVTVGTIDEYVLEPRNAAAEGRPWERMMIRPSSAATPTGAEDEVALTAPWGWTSFPVTIVNATELQASRFFNRPTSPYGVAGSPDSGSEVRLLSKVDPDVSVMLGDYRRWWAAA